MKTVWIFGWLRGLRWRLLPHSHNFQVTKQNMCFDCMHSFEYETGRALEQKDCKYSSNKHQRADRTAMGTGSATVWQWEPTAFDSFPTCFKRTRLLCVRYNVQVNLSPVSGNSTISHLWPLMYSFCENKIFVGLLLFLFHFQLKRRTWCHYKCHLYLEGFVVSHHCNR